MFDRKRKIKEKLAASYGKVKDDTFAFELIEKYFRNKKRQKQGGILSDKSCNDLDFNELFMFLDRTASKVGQQCLYDRLRTIPAEKENLVEEERLIARLGKDSALRADLLFQLDKLSHSDAYYLTSLFQEEQLKEPRWFFVIRLLSFTNLLSILLLPFNPQLIFLLTALFILNAGIHYWNKNNVYPYLGSIPQLLKMNGVAKVFLKNELFRPFAGEVPKSVAIIDQIRNRLSFFKLSAKLESDMEVIVWAILEFFKILFLLEPLLLFGVLKRLDTKRKEVEELFRFVGEIDCLLSIAALRHGLDSYCLPEFLSDSQSLEMKEVYHPLIINCVSNSLQIHHRSVLLTGSNMSGKTSFIRTIGINAITGMTLNTCFAERFSMPRTHLSSAIRISDDLMNDRSYYFEEVLTIQEMMEKCAEDEPHLFLLDELFKGTNTIERIAAGKAVLSFLAKGKNMVFVSTHDIELADLLKDEYLLFHFSERVDHNTVDFDFKLKDGKLKNRNAIRILQLNGYPEEVIREAIDLSKELDNITVTK